MASTGGQNEAILNSNNLSVTKFNLCVSSVCQLALRNGNSIEGFVINFYYDIKSYLVKEADFFTIQ